MSNRRATVSHPPAATATAAAMGSYQRSIDGSLPNASPVHTVAVALSSSHPGTEPWGHGHPHLQHNHLYPSTTAASPAANFSSFAGDAVYGQSPPSHRTSFPPPSQHPAPPHFHNRQSYSTYSSSLPPDSFPRTISHSTNYGYDGAQPYLPTSSSSTPTRSAPSQYQLYQPSTHTTSLSHTGAGYERRPNYESKPSSTDSDYDRGVSSNLPEYSYPMAPAHRLQHDLPRPNIRLQLSPYQDQREQPSHQHRQHAQYQDMPEPSLHNPPKQPQFQLQQPLAQPRLGQTQPPQPQDVSQRIPPPPIRTRWSDDVTRDGPPPLSYPSGSSSMMSISSASHRFSPSTPRTLLSGSMLRQSSSDDYPLTESPLDFRELAYPQRIRVGVVRNKYDRDLDHDMEQCSEQDDAREREAGHVDHLDDTRVTPGKRQRLSSRASQPTSAKYIDSSLKAANARMEVEAELGEHEDEQSSLASTSSSRKPSVSGSVQGDERPSSGKSKPSKTTAATAATQKRPQRRASDQMTLGEVIDKIDEEIHPEDEPQSLAGKGLRIYAQCVRRRVEARGSTSYNELVHELFGGKAGENVDDLPEVPGQENIRRRVYDALNVLEALDIISFDNKDIRWVGLEESKVVQDVSRQKAAQVLAQRGRLPHNDEGDEESEEPEDDDMEIEKLQREVEAMKMQNDLVRAQLQDQVTRHVQVLNLVKRNKKRETKEQEKEERRRQRKEEKRARALAADQDPSMTDVGPMDCSDSTARKVDRHHRRRRTSREASERPEGEVVADSMDDETHMRETEDEEARQRRKQARRERRARKDERAQRKSEKLDRVQLPFFAVRMPGYTGQSSDSEENISVVRRYREEQKPRKSGKSKRQCESTGEETTRVRIQIPHNDELSIISDTEILGDLGHNAVTLEDLQAMLPTDLMESAQYVVSARDRHLRAQRRDSDIVSIVDGLTIRGEEDRLSGATNVIVRGGHERQIVRAASENVVA
ncbi:Transcription factor Dp-2 [Linnemannia elongata]|nr:Transcription factor Dp-2 [Linnemannia elongata]